MTGAPAESTNRAPTAPDFHECYEAVGDFPEVNLGLKGIYTVLDTGPKIQGRQIGLYMWSCYEALDFGRRPITLTVLRLGCNPKNTAADHK